MAHDDGSSYRIAISRRRGMIELPYELPEDFRDFWQETVNAALAAPIEVSNFKFKTFDHPTHQVDSFQFIGIDGTPRYGWIAYPAGARYLPAFLWVPPYGRESKLPDDYGTREGMVSMSFNLHGETEFHQEKYRVERGYMGIGAGDPDTWIYRRLFQDCIIALRILQAQVQVDEEKIGVSGMSQGGGLSIWLGAFAPMVKAVCSDMPFGCALGHSILNYAYRYPLKEMRDFADSIPVGEARVLHTLSYYDTVFHAQHCAVPTHVSVGLKDPSCRPPNVKMAFEALPGDKLLTELDWGHDWHPSMVESNLHWFQNKL